MSAKDYYTYLGTVIISKDDNCTQYKEKFDAVVESWQSTSLPNGNELGGCHVNKFPMIAIFNIMHNQNQKVLHTIMCRHNLMYYMTYTPYFQF